jgi:hypothetical protein
MVTVEPAWLLIGPPYSIDEYYRTEQEAIELFPTYAQHAITMLKNFFTLSKVP